MSARWIVAITAWVAAAAATVGCAIAWGPEGRMTVLVISAMAFLFTTINTAILVDRQHPGTATAAPTSNSTSTEG